MIFIKFRSTVCINFLVMYYVNIEQFTYFNNNIYVHVIEE